MFANFIGHFMLFIQAVTHLVPNAYGPWTFGPQLIGISGQTVPNKFSPHGQMVPKNWVPMDKWSQPIWSPWTNGPQNIPIVQGDRLWGSRDTGTKLDGDYLSKGTKILGTVCPGKQIFRDHCPGGQEVGDHKSKDQMGSGPNASQPYIDVQLSQS